MEQKQLEKEVNQAIAAMHGDRNLHRIISYLLTRNISYFGIGQDVREILGMSQTPLQPIKEAWEAEESKPMPRTPHHNKPKANQQPKVRVP